MRTSCLDRHLMALAVVIAPLVGGATAQTLTRTLLSRLTPQEAGLVRSLAMAAADGQMPCTASAHPGSSGVVVPISRKL